MTSPLANEKTQPVLTHNMDCSLSWRNVTKVVGSNKDITLVQNCSGIVRSGEVVALMGLSGSGKTTLMKILSAETGVYSGTVYIAGKPFDDQSRRLIGYVPQKGIFLDSLTVKEHLLFASLLRQPKQTSHLVKEEFVEQILDLLSLRHAENNQIRNLSGGEQRRCSIGNELLASLRLLLLDEPISGLDSAVAAQLLWSLQRLADGEGININDLTVEGEFKPKKTASLGRMGILISIHQPSTGTFYSFDRLILVSCGKVVYHGPPNKCLEYLKQVGYAPPRVWNENGENIELPYNPADFIMELMFSTEIQGHKLEIGHQTIENQTIDRRADVINENITARIVMIPNYNSSADESTPVESENRHNPRFLGWWPRHILAYLYDETDALDMIEIEIRNYEVSHIADAIVAHIQSERLQFFDEFKILMKRTLIIARRSSKMSFLSALECIFIGFLAGLTWFQTGNSENSIVDKAGFIFFSVAYWFFSSVFEGVLEFLPERNIVIKDQASGAYRITSYFLARTLGGIPSRIFTPVIYAVISYPIALSTSKFSSPEGFALWTGLIGIFVLTALAGEAVGVLIGTTFIQLDKCITVSTIVALSMTIFGGFYIKVLPIFIKPLQYLSVLKYGYDAAAQIEFSYPSNIECDSGEVIISCYADTADGDKLVISNTEIIDFLGVGSVSVTLNVLALILIYLICRGFALLILLFTMKTCE